jgi:Fe-S cluster assembly protein SufD
MTSAASATRAAEGRSLHAAVAAGRVRADEPAWLRATRRAAAEAFERTGLPTTRHEDWRHTNVSAIADTLSVPAPPALVSRADARRLVVPGLAGPVIVFVNGRFAPGLSTSGALSPGLTVATLADAASRSAETLERHLARDAALASRPFAALNTAIFDDGALIAVADNCGVDTPIQVVFLSTVTPAPAMSAPRVLAVLGRNSQARLIETFGSAGPAGGLTNAVTEVVVGDGSVLEHCRIQREPMSASHIGCTSIRLGRSSRCVSHAIALGAVLARHESVAVLDGEGADCTLNGLYLAGEGRLVDNHTEIDHAGPHGTSRELYKGILRTGARGVFDGWIRVRPGAPKSDARQTNKTLLLSGDAQINTRPRLEILANDVKCTHGATVGQLSEEALFYLRARGISLGDARDLLVRAFASEVTDRIGLEPVRVDVERLLAGWLSGIGGEGASR